MLSGKTVLIGITGGIAAYKICELIRMFKRKNANVRVVCTPNALNFVTRLTLQNLSGNDVAVEQFEVVEFKPEHISCADGADIMVIAPCSANTLSKIAHGYCDNLLTTIVCAFNKPVLIAPAMNCNMWEDGIIQDNLKKLESHGCEILPPESGFLACGARGQGRLCKLEKIYDRTVGILNNSQKLAGKKIVITAGGTIEDLDPVRFLSNRSSGKMGLALAKVAIQQGAEVTLIATPALDPRSCPHFSTIQLIQVQSAFDMKTAVDAEFDTADCIIMAAAVADYRPKEASAQKFKKTSEDEISIKLIKNPDILKGLVKKRDNAQKPTIIGFCAESENLLENAKTKIQSKGCDFLVANDISRTDIGFSSDENEVLIINKDLNVKKIEKAAKTIIAAKILEEIYNAPLQGG
jgi:phosphopantothenoylcysteine decarboxylase/phosphopantothenate--cysteine ligase